MSNSPSRLGTLMLFLALAVPTTVLAQTEDTADLNGVVLDASGRPVAGYPMNLITPQWGQVVMHPSEDDGTFVVTGLPPGDYGLRVFMPGGGTDNPIASKQVTLAAGQKARIEIRLSSDHPGGAAAGTSLGAIAVNWTAVMIAGMVLAAALVVFFVVRSQRSAGA